MLRRQPQQLHQQKNIGSNAKRGKSTASTSLTETKKPEPDFIKQLRYQNSDEFAKKTWLSDPSTYPIFVVLGAALLVCAGRCIHGFFYCDDVKVNRDRKNRIVRDLEEKQTAGTGQSFISRHFAPEEGNDPVFMDGKMVKFDRSKL